MGIRRLVTLSVGAALGAGTMYLFDPEHGEDRRRAARRHAIAQARQGAGRALRDAREQVQGVTLAAVAGYQQGRSVVADPGEPGDSSRR